MADTPHRPVDWREVPLAGLLNLRGDAADPGFRAAVREATGLEPPSTPNTTAEAAGRALLWLGPDEWLLLLEAEAPDPLAEALRTALGDRHAAVVDVGGSRVRFSVAGPAVRDLLAAGCALDLHPRAFPPGRCAQSTVGRVPAILHHPGDADRFDLLVRPSYAGWFAAWLADAILGFAEKT